MNKKLIQYSIKTYDKNQKQTFENKFYIKSNMDYIDVLLQMIKELKDYNFEFDSQDLTMILANNKNPREVYVMLERVKE